MSYAFRLTFKNKEEFERELAVNLRHRRTFVCGVTAKADRSPCLLEVEHPETGVIVELRGEVVFVQEEGPARGAGVELTEPQLDELLEAFAAVIEVESAPPEPGREAVPVRRHTPPPRVRSERPTADVPVRARLQTGRPSVEMLLPLVGFGIDEPEAIRPPRLEIVEVNAVPRHDPRDVEDDADESDSMETRAAQESVHLRVRKLTPAERDRLARAGNLAERTALERAFGGSVWEGLLQNPQITGAEVARIAKNGLVPATVLAQIANNAGWLARPEVRRALLQNRRLATAQIDAVLRQMPLNELRLLPAQTAYPARVREAARSRMGR